MDVKDFCQAIEAEMTAWKSKLYDTMRKVEKLGTAEKEKVLMKVMFLIKKENCWGNILA